MRYVLENATSTKIQSKYDENNDNNDKKQISVEILINFHLVREKYSVEMCST